jgi:hypothetical protein
MGEPAAAGPAAAAAGAGIGERLGPLLGPPPPPSFEPLVTALINEVAGEPDADEARLVLDDYHVISSPLVRESLGFLLEHRPAGLQLAGLSLRGRDDVGGFVAAFAGATGMSWTTWPRRCWSDSPAGCVSSCWRPRCWSGCRGSCAMR